MRFLLPLLLSSLAWSAESTRLFRDPGPIQSLNLAAGPGGLASAPVSPFVFVEEETTGVQPKAVVTDARQKKWMVKFGEEAKSENFASRIAWAAGYPVRASYFVNGGKISGMPTSGRLAKFVGPDGAFKDARFQMFDDANFRQVESGTLNLADRRDDQRELNGLKLALLLVSNWDVKTGNSAVFEIGGQRYSVISDWGSSLGDPGSTDRTERKWNCEAFKRQTGHLMDGVEAGYVHFNYAQYAGRHESALSEEIKVEDLNWFLDRVSKLTRSQLKAGAVASGASEQEATCYSDAILERLSMFSDIAKSKKPVTTIRTTTTTTTTTK